MQLHERLPEKTVESAVSFRDPEHRMPSDMTRSINLHCDLGLDIWWYMVMDGLHYVTKKKSDGSRTKIRQVGDFQTNLSGRWNLKLSSKLCVINTQLRLETHFMLQLLSTVRTVFQYNEGHNSNNNNKNTFSLCVCLFYPVWCSQISLTLGTVF